MQRDPLAYLWDINTALGHVEQFVHATDVSEYLNNLMLRSAVERQLLIAGEAMIQLRKLDPESAQRIPDASAICGFRNVLVHGHAQLDDA